MVITARYSPVIISLYENLFEIDSRQSGIVEASFLITSNICLHASNGTGTISINALKRRLQSRFLFHFV